MCCWVKRITAINGLTTNPNDTTPLNQFVDDTASSVASNDNHANWPSNYLLGELDAGLVQPGDEIEYTVYFLNAGGGAAADVRICDWIQPNQTFVTGQYGGNDIALQLGEWGQSHHLQSNRRQRRRPDGADHHRRVSRFRGARL